MSSELSNTAWSVGAVGQVRVGEEVRDLGELDRLVLLGEAGRRNFEARTKSGRLEAGS